MNLLLCDTIAFQAMFALTTGVILMDFARTLVPDNDALIGLLAAIPPLCQLLQVPTIVLVERVRNRRAITVISATAGRLAWFLYPLIPFIENKTAAVSLLVATQFWYYGMTNVAGCAISSWMRDLVPEHRISGYFGKRLALSTGMGALTLGAVWLLLPEKTMEPGLRLKVLAGCFAAGGVAGLISSAFIAAAPEPEAPARPPTPILRLLAEPLRDPAYRKFLAFNGVWFAVYGMTWQFFPKQLLARYELTLATTTGLTMIGLLLNAAFFRLWAKVAEHFSDRALLAGALPLYLLSLALWPVAELVTPALGAPLAVGAFLLGGAAYAGMQLGATNLTLKGAPRGKAAAYVATNALVIGGASAISPILGGLFADAADGKGRFEGLHHARPPVSGLAILFTLAILVGCVALRLLRRVPGDATPPVRNIYTKVLTEATAATAAFGGLIGARRLSPFGLIFPRAAEPQKQEPSATRTATEPDRPRPTGRFP